MKNNTIKVLHFAPGFLYGGIESLILLWYTHLPKSDFKIELLLRTHDDNASALIEFRTLGGVYHRLAKLKPLSMLKYAKSVKSFFQRNHDYDILHAHGADPFVFYYALKFGIKNIIIHAHAAGTKPQKYSYYKKCLHMLAMRYPTHRIACSTKAADFLFGNKMCTIIPNAINAIKFEYNNTTRIAYRHQLKWENKAVIGHIGRFTYEKNHLFLLELFAIMHKLNPSSHLVLIGDGNGTDQGVLEKHIAQLGIQDNVSFLGNRSDISSLLQAFDLFVLPSLSEGLGIVAIESQAAGLRTIVSDVLPNEVFITDIINKISLNETADSWAKQCLLALGMPVDRKSYANQVQETLLDVSNHIKAMSSYYRSII